jgi:hypothetical protein
MATNIKRHIFIGGCSRSGTTLLGAMLGAHSDIICTPESHFKIDVLRSSAWQNEAIDMSAVLEMIRQHWRFKLWQLAIKSTLKPIHEMNHSYAALLNEIVAQYARQQAKAEATIWVDHTPENISYTSRLVSLFPQARMIHIVRDGRAVAASIMPLDWGPNSIIKAAAWWTRMVSYGLAAESAMDNVIRIKYEDLVFYPEKSLRSLCEFLEIDYQPGMVKATGFTPPAYTTGQHTLIGLKPETRLATRWEERLTPRQIEIFEHLTRDLLTFLGYPMQYGVKAKAPTFTEIQMNALKEFWRGEIINRIKWLIRSYPVWLSRDFYKQAKWTDTNN